MPISSKYLGTESKIQKLPRWRHIYDHELWTATLDDNIAGMLWAVRRVLRFFLPPHLVFPSLLYLMQIPQSLWFHAVFRSLLLFFISKNVHFFIRTPFSSGKPCCSYFSRDLSLKMFIAGMRKRKARSAASNEITTIWWKRKRGSRSGT